MVFRMINVFFFYKEKKKAVYEKHIFFIWKDWEISFFGS